MELWGETVPRPVLRRRTAGGMSCQVSTAIRAPQVLLSLNEREVGAEEDAMLFVGVDWGRAPP